MLNVAIGIPSGDRWVAEFGESLANMTAYFNSAAAGDHDRMLQIINVRGSLLSMSRTKILADAFENGCTHLLFLDSDMTFPPDTLNRLLARGLPVVACNYIRKEIPAIPVSTALDGGPLHTTQDKIGIEQVRHTGFGAMLIDLESIKAIPEPWFPITWHREKRTYIGEDVYFGHLLKTAHIPVFVDHDMSKHVGHVGVFEYGNQLSDIAV